MNIRIGSVQTIFHDTRNSPHHVQAFRRKRQNPLRRYNCGPSRDGFATILLMPRVSCNRRSSPRRRSRTSASAPPSLSTSCPPVSPPHSCPARSSNALPLPLSIPVTFSLVVDLVASSRRARLPRPSLRQLQNEPSYTSPGRFRQRAAGIAANHIHHLPDRLHDIASYGRQCPQVRLRDGLGLCVSLRVGWQWLQARGEISQN